MSSPTLRIMFALFIIAHGLVHTSLSSVPAPKSEGMRTPYWPGWWRTEVDPAWPISQARLNPRLVITLCWVLWLAAALLNVAAGLGLWGVPGLHNFWQPLTVAGSIVSLVLLILFWHPWLFVGAAIDAFLILGVYSGWFLRWFNLN